MIRLPASLIFTPTGCTIFRNGKIPLKRLTNADNRPSEGMASPQFNAQTVQKLVFNGYVEEIFVRMPALLNVRSQIMNTTKLVTYGILYKKMNPTLATMFIKSNTIQLFNQKNRTKQIMDIHSIDKKQAELLYITKQIDFQNMEKEIREDIEQMITNDKGLELEDKELLTLSLDKFISFLDKRIWYLYYIIYQSSMRDEIRKEFSCLIFHYLERTKIATHLATMLMELVQNAEKAHFERLIRKHRLVASTKDMDKFMRNRENRNQLIKHAMNDKQFLQLAWRFDSGETSTGKPYKIEIIISNHGLISDDMQQKLMQKMKANTDQDLSTFFEADNSNADKLGAGLGLLYLSYLKDECKEAGIKFTPSIFPEIKLEKTTAKIQLIF